VANDWDAAGGPTAYINWLGGAESSNRQATDDTAAAPLSNPSN
jgi:hypothetical protein